MNIPEIASRYPALQLIVLFGSRAREDAESSSDWDFGYIASPDFDSLAFYSELVIYLATDNVDLVDLKRANGLLRFRVAQEGKVIFERRAGEYEKFWQEAVHFWYDAGPSIRREYNALLESLG